MTSVCEKISKIRKESRSYMIIKDLVALESDLEPRLRHNLNYSIDDKKIKITKVYVFFQKNQHVILFM